MAQSNTSQQMTDDRKLILIVEDEFVSREILKMTIEKDYDTLVAENGRQAVEHIEASGDRLSLVLLDLVLPDLTLLDLVLLGLVFTDLPASSGIAADIRL